MSSLRTILLIDQDEERVEVRRRDDADLWAFGHLGWGGSPELPELALCLTVAAVYDGLAL